MKTKPKTMQGPIPEAQFKQLQRAVLRAHFDANETIFLERELTQLRAQLYTTIFPELLARTFMPFATDISPTTDTYSYKVLTPVGAAKFIGNKAKDLPRVDVVAREVLGKVFPIGVSYGWDIFELKEAVARNVPISEIKAGTARDAIEQGIDEILCFGDFSASPVGQTEPQLAGLATNPDVIAQGIEAGGFWPGGGLDPKVVTADLNGMLTTPRQRTKRRFSPDTILLPDTHWDYVATTPYTTLTGETILSVFQKNNPGILVAPWWKLNNAGVGGAPRAVSYKRDKLVLEGIVPMGFEQLPPQAQGLELIVPCVARAGGVKVYQPSGMQYTDFATS